MEQRRRLTVAYTPDSDDAFYYFGLETGRVNLPGYAVEFDRQPMSVLNAAAREARYHVTAISSVLYPLVADRYAVLSVGTSVGRGYGPVLVSKDGKSPEHLRGRRVGVAGVFTTGWFLLRLFFPGTIPVEMAFDQIGAAVATGELDAGVMVHEELLYYPRLGLRRVLDLGAEWCRRNRLPLPVGLNLVRRDLGMPAMQRVCAGIRRSLLFGQEHAEEALAWVSRFGRGGQGQCTRQFVDMFANQDSVRMPADVREGLRVLLAEAFAMGFVPGIPPLDIVEGAAAVAPKAV